ncbi:MAG TPA: ABC transporter substrate-binding protein [Spirochaetia bacterium]|nr:ABC transporter substrate-binding protein [Spirochaetia bacterium]
MAKRVLLALLALAILLPAAFAQAPGKYPIPATFKQSPMLDDLVKSGKLPPVKDRLPKHPLVVGLGTDMSATDLPDWQVGKYGGTERMPRIWPTADYGMFIQDNQPIIRGVGLAQEPFYGNVVESYDVSADQKTFTFHMRDGMKWSDGQPVTSDDVRFTYEDFLLNKDLTPVFPTWLRSGNVGTGDPCKMAFPDPYTFSITFSQPYGAFPTMLADTLGWRGYTELIKPKHYLKNYHTKYTALSKMAAEIQKDGFKEGEWWQLFNKKDCTNWEVFTEDAIGFPSLSPWIAKTITQQTIIMERNPYFWKVDTAGNQLPYIDTLRSDLLSDVKNVTMKIISGEVDHSYEFGTLPQLPLYKENQAKAGYNMNFYLMHRTEADFLLNFTYPDPVWKKVVSDVRFRQALNKAVKYSDIVENVYFGFAKVPYTVPGSYDPAGANKLLDEMGLNKKDADGFRLGPDGKRFTIPIEIQAYFDTIPKCAEIVAENWKAVGLYTTVKVNEASLQNSRQSANQVAVYFQWPLRADVWWAVWITPWDSSPLWQLWFNTGGKQGEEPPAAMKECYDLLQKMYVVSPAEREKLHTQFLKNVADNLWYGITAEDIQYLVMTNKNMGNVAKQGFGIASQFSGEQFFFKQ